jgi:hypothetical protein
MVSPLWWIALGVVVVALAPLYLAGRRVARELDDLRRSVRGLAEVRPALDALRNAVTALTRDLEDLGPR